MKNSTAAGRSLRRKGALLEDHWLEGSDGRVFISIIMEDFCTQAVVSSVRWYRGTFQENSRKTDMKTAAGWCVLEVVLRRDNFMILRLLHLSVNGFAGFCSARGITKNVRGAN